MEDISQELGNNLFSFLMTNLFSLDNCHNFSFTQERLNKIRVNRKKIHFINELIAYDEYFKTPPPPDFRFNPPQQGGKYSESFKPSILIIF
tara:strand:+ start:5761 stop:6033 length:273 start_codon:yes stop_codon:yes gene_type:complete